MAEQTVREQLVAALDEAKLEMATAREIFRTQRDEMPMQKGLSVAIVNAKNALDRARAEPEGVDGCICPDCPRCAGATNEDDTCGCWEAGHRAGTEAQREPAGRGTT